MTDTTCTQSEAGMTKVPHPVGSVPRVTPLLHKPSQASLLLLAPGRTQGFTPSAPHLLSPSLLPGLSPEHEKVTIRCGQSSVGQPEDSSLGLQGSGGQYSSGAHSGLPTGSSVPRAPTPQNQCPTGSAIRGWSQQSWCELSIRHMRTESFSKLHMQKEVQKDIFLRAFMPRNIPRD